MLFVFLLQVVITRLSMHVDLNGGKILRIVWVYVYFFVFKKTRPNLVSRFTKESNKTIKELHHIGFVQLNEITKETNTNETSNFGCCVETTQAKINTSKKNHDAFFSCFWMKSVICNIKPLMLFIQTNRRPVYVSDVCLIDTIF